MPVSRKRKKKLGSESSSEPQPIVRESERLTGTIARLGRLTLILAGPTILLSAALFVYFGRAWYNRAEQVRWLDLLSLCVLFAMLIALFTLISIDIANVWMKIGESQRHQALRRTTELKLVVAICSTSTYYTALRTGNLDQFASFLNVRVFPALGHAFNYVISNLVGWAISGIVGNACFAAVQGLIRKSQDRTPKDRQPRGR